MCVCLCVCKRMPVSLELFWWQCVVTGSRMKSALRQRLALSSPSIIHTPVRTHTHTYRHTHRYTLPFCRLFICHISSQVVKSPALLSFFLLFFGGFFCTCISVSLCVFICLCLSPRTPITPLKSMNCSICPGKQAENKYWPEKRGQTDKQVKKRDRKPLKQRFFFLVKNGKRLLKVVLSPWLKLIRACH